MYPLGQLKSDLWVLTIPMVFQTLLSFALQDDCGKMELLKKEPSTSFEFTSVEFFNPTFSPVAARSFDPPRRCLKRQGAPGHDMT